MDMKERENETIIGGTVVDDSSELPFLAWLGDNDGTMVSQFCGGTLISDRIVLTAGHCIYGEEQRNANLWARLKLTDFQKDQGVARNVINWRRHEKYDPSTLHNDIAILLLDQAVPPEMVQPLQLSDGSQDYEHYGDKVVAGWGSMNEACTSFDTLLRRTLVPMGVTGPECSTMGSEVITMKDDYDEQRQCCAGDYMGNQHYPGCGDSGGPLLARDGESFTQVGLVSWSFGTPYPDVFTRVSYYRDWIKQMSEELVAAGEHEAVAKYGPRGSTPLY